MFCVLTKHEDKLVCDVCGTVYEKPPVLPYFVLCPRSPDLRPSADELGLPPLEIDTARQVVQWLTSGKPERTAETQTSLRKICDRCWNRPKCWTDEAIGQAALRCATWPCPIHSWEHGGHGCGDELHRLIARLTRQEVTHDCGCGDWITMMNGWTAAENREHIDETAAKMQQEADNRGWLLKIVARFPLAPTGTKWMIEWAIRQAEKWEGKTGCQ